MCIFLKLNKIILLLLKLIIIIILIIIVFEIIMQEDKLVLECTAKDYLRRI